MFPLPDPTKPSATYEAGCHCGYIKMSVTLSPPLPEQKVVRCNCSACSKLGYLLVYPTADQVTWHHGGRERCSAYRFNAKDKEQIFCPKCGTSIGIDFLDFAKPHRYGINVRTFYGVDLDGLQYKDLDGMNLVPPAQDLSGQWWDEEKGVLK